MAWKTIETGKLEPYGTYEIEVNEKGEKRKVGRVGDEVFEIDMKTGEVVDLLFMGGSASAMWHAIEKNKREIEAYIHTLDLAGLATFRRGLDKEDYYYQFTREAISRRIKELRR